MSFVLEEYFLNRCLMKIYLLKHLGVALFLNFILLLRFGKLSKIPVLKLISSIFLAVSIKLNPVALDRTFKSN